MRRMMTVRKPNISLLLLLTLLFGVFTLGYFLGMNRQESRITVSVSEEITEKPTLSIGNLPENMGERQISFPISINHAGKEDLAALPGIGDTLAQRILDYREKNGDFTSAEDILNVEGIGAKKLEQILDLIVIGG